MKRIKEILIATVIYFVTMFTLLTAVYRFMDNWDFTEFKFFIAGALVFLVAIGWGYVLSQLIFAPKKQMENTLTSLTNDIIHELNIPLSTIKANSEMLKKNMKDEKSLKRIQRIEDASLRLEKLYNELVYTIHKEIHEIEKERFDVKSLIEERVAVFAEQQRNPFVLSLEYYEIEVDKIGFEQMLDNLISNAMKYSSKTSPITVMLDQKGLEVKDEGVGMSPTELLRMHERYYQADEAQEGAGLGLALVKAYCEAENIAIQIESEKDRGTQIVLDLSKVHV